MRGLRILKPQLARAIEEACQIEMDYFSEEGIKKRTVDPWYLLIRNKSYYLFGFCHLEKDIRCFNLKRVQNCEIKNNLVSEKCIPLSIIFKLKSPSLEEFYADPNRFTAFAYPQNFELDITQLKVRLYRELKKDKLLKNNPSVSNKKISNGYPCTIHLSKMKQKGICRSPLEHKVIRDLNKNNDVLELEVEPIRIQYFYKRISSHYKPDLMVTYQDGRRELIEIKLSGDIGSPKNQAKFKAAQDFAGKEGITFRVVGTYGNSHSFKNIADWSEIEEIEPVYLDPNDLSDYQPHAWNQAVKRNKTNNNKVGGNLVEVENIVETDKPKKNVGCTFKGIFRHSNSRFIYSGRKVFRHRFINY
ncbi:WYL domain-containing protein [Mesobacillus jeotgali]|uniref:WYL domain-containing protein n=1 Tax=Mesobacillus jeotgali TaxID=129985 RepID=UPI0017809DF7|nr:WYL domain-containing protein [Mesobacillus jeotgali]UYZ21668.1 WYL domain-containing protein [Mesobacillus jeotgali]